jgi:hypothetical protein
MPEGLVNGAKIGFGFFVLFYFVLWISRQAGIAGVKERFEGAFVFGFCFACVEVIDGTVNNFEGTERIRS